jgi:NTP pyrophosphatase (non-canonical NTP hydrolase)
MIHNIPKPDISPNFTVEDIHRIREWNYERTKDATPEEYDALLKQESGEVLRRMAELKANQRV